MSQQALDKYLKDLKPGGLLLIDSELVKNLPPERRFTLHKFPFSRIASDEFGRTIVANVIMLGALTGLTHLVSFEAMESSIRTSVPKGTEEMNLKALKRGMDLTKAS
jgi:2-oxoglutarate ferredoxin oxidoreductase subunit gamma